MSESISGLSEYLVIYVNNYDEVRVRILATTRRDDAEDICRALGIRKILVLTSLRKCVDKFGEHLRKDKK